jgi:hypothetical protein
MVARFMCLFHHTMHALCLCVCMCGLFVTLCVRCNFEADERVRISKNTLKKPLTKPSLEEHDQWQLGGKVSVQPKHQTPLMSLSGTRKVVRTPTNPFEAAGTAEVFVPKEIIARRIQDIFAGPNKGRKADHYLVVWEGYPFQKDYTWATHSRKIILSGGISMSSFLKRSK